MTTATTTITTEKQNKTTNKLKVVCTISIGMCLMVEKKTTITKKENIKKKRQNNTEITL